VRPAWTDERPGLSYAVAVAGALLAVLGGLVFDWTVGAGFADLRELAHQDAFGVVTQLYVRFLYVPLLIGAIATGLLAAVGRMAARVAIGAAGVLTGLVLIATVIWVELGHLGTDSSRRHALPVLLLVAAVGVASVVLGAGAIFEDGAPRARSLAALLAGLAVTLHLYAAFHIGEAAAGAWCASAGFALLVIAPAIPHQRIVHRVR
jgi:hypothetical protein